MLLLFKFYLVFGLAFFAIFFAIFFRNLKNSRIRIARYLPMFAIFGLLQGFHVWSDFYLLLYQHEYHTTENIETFRAIKIWGSFLTLSSFAWCMMDYTHWQRVTFIRNTMLIVLVIFSIGLIYRYHQLNYTLFIEQTLNQIRWIFGMGSSVLAGATVYTYAKHIEEDGYGSAPPFQWLGIALICYGCSVGFISESMSIWFQSLRLICAYGMLIALWYALRVFDEERDKQLQTTVQTSQQDAKLIELGELTSAVAHEIKTPLSSALMSCDLLEMQLSDNEQYSRQINRIRYGLARASEISQEVLNYAHHKQIKRIPLSLHKVIESAISLNQFRLEDFTLDISLDDKLEISGDAGLLEEVFSNIISNAVDASQHDKILHVYGYQDKLSAIVQLSDHGGGMPETLLAKATQPFFTTKEKGDGTGMGLALCKQTILQHNGELRLSNNPHGLVVEVRLPRNTL
ncbi:sensor histidine kinase [Vibrio palustris]|uniref:histidine kinase n=1 Tax=Vibrio palustris TaxID=1918946 RepID=A0A1R4B586_9VIBR|nr:HAMP domain-containing sensor histidine kinase [Vibrio palustris]SJL84069.1 Globin-coupled histidine kinase [Vibrio palustris]